MKRHIHIVSIPAQAYLGTECCECSNPIEPLAWFFLAGYGATGPFCQQECAREGFDPEENEFITSTLAFDAEPLTSQ